MNIPAEEIIALKALAEIIEEANDKLSEKSRHTIAGFIHTYIAACFHEQETVLIQTILTFVRLLNATLNETEMRNNARNN